MQSKHTSEISLVLTNVLTDVSLSPKVIVPPENRKLKDKLL